jgi:hypothetical protein
MIRDFFIYLLTMFVVEPFQAEINQALAARGAPPEVVQQVTQCVNTAPPALADKAAGDWWWGASTVVSVWLGRTTADAVLTQAVPICGPAIAAARSALGQTRA